LRQVKKGGVINLKEIWKFLKGIVENGDNYEVSNLGKVRNINTSKVLKDRMNPKGYLNVVLYLDGKTKHHSVHRLVALAFLPNPLNKSQVNHIKGREKTNNKVDNLEWCSNQENQRHAFDNGLQSARRGEKNNFSTLSESKVLEIRSLLSKGVSQYKIAEMFNVGRSCIASIQAGRTWGHLKTDGFTPFSKDTLGENNNKSKLTKQDVLKIRELYSTNLYSQKNLGEMFNVSKTSIRNIINNKTWKHIS
jgi:predicted XRE-type DNA-binding protein